MSVCVIPARGGSKRIPRKNIRHFRGQPMIAWSIQAAMESGCFQRLIVSTDDEEIARVASSFGAEVPFTRPAELADDYSGTREVVTHAIKVLGNDVKDEDQICCIYATAPFIRPSDLIEAKALLEASRPRSVVYAATSFGFPIQRAVRINAEGYSEAIDPISADLRSQDLAETYHDAGQFYWASSSSWHQAGNLFDRGRPLILPRWRVQDIDTEEDWKRAELMHTVLEDEINIS